MANQKNVVTQEHFDEVIGQIHTKLNKLDDIVEKLDWLMGKYSSHDEEHTLLNGKVSEHSGNNHI